MPLQIVRNDITKMNVDAIVNAAKESLLGGGGVDGAIHRAAGSELLEECRSLGGCATGDAKITGAYLLPAKYIIHTVGPIWQDGHHREKELLQSCYRRSLELALENACETVAFPLISAGAFGYPKEEALQVAVQTIGEFLLKNDMTVYLVVFDRSTYRISSRLFADIQEFVDDIYVEEHQAEESQILRRRNFFQQERKKSIQIESQMEEAYAVPLSANVSPTDAKHPLSSATGDKESLDELLNQIDESFSQMVLRKIDEAGIKDSECYKKANMDRKLFSKIRKDPWYKPRKQTAIALGIALELSLPEMNELLRKAGFALSHSNKFDVIVEYFVRHQNYNIFEINEALFLFDQPLLG